MRRVYLDYAATTPVAPEVMKAMEPYFSMRFGNPGSLHAFGQEAMAAVDAARETIARAIGADFREVVFASSATEANNLALRGAVMEAVARGVKDPKVIVSSIEHESVLEAARGLEADLGAEIVMVPVDKEGFIDIAKIKEALDRRTVLVSMMYANNEIGTVEPIAEIGEIIKKFREETAGALPFFHTDAAQAFQFLECRPEALGADLMTFSSHKIYGPKGAAALYIKEGIKKEITPVIRGGGQEFGFRSGTENVPAIAGFARAVELITKDRAKGSKQVAAQRDLFWKKLKAAVPGVQVNGPSPDGEGCLPNILNVYFPEQSAEVLLTKMDLAGIAASSGSACRSRALVASHVIEALGYPQERAKSSIRFSFGRPTTREDINSVATFFEKLS